jgi:flagellar motor component MotA
MKRRKEWQNTSSAFEVPAAAAYNLVKRDPEKTILLWKGSLIYGGESMIQWNAELARALSCTEPEKRGLAPLIRRFLDLDRRARSQGFQALESEKADGSLMAVGLKLVIEGLSGEILEDILATYLLAEGKSGWPFLKDCVVAEGLLSLAEMDDPALMVRKLIAYYGADRALKALEELEGELQPKGDSPGSAR